MRRGGAIPARFVDGYPELLAEVSATGRLPGRTELDGLRHLGEQAAEQGHGLRGLVGLYLRATRRAWDTLPGVTGATGAAELRRTGGSVLAAADAAVAALAEGYERAQRLAVRQEEAARQEFIDDLLYGRSDLGRLSERAERFGLRLARAHTVTVAWSGERYDDAHPLARRLERELVGRFGEHQVLLTTKEGRLVCIAPAAETSVPEALAALATAPEAGGPGRLQLAVGRPHSGPAGVVRSYEEALSAIELAERLGLDAAMLRAADLLVFPVLLRDRAAMADLVLTVLGPLREARGGAEPLLETLAAYSAARYVGAEAARQLRLSVRALTYRLDRIRTLTGYDADDPLQRYTLETAAMGARLLDWPARPL
ncbi:PucR family transcriptional regulator [Peterkaempfera bronchialis]|uniref:PucR family transcriptional regulator n=1 Tax=Peterkaempfera bronchialis TaxID=2126346 RepID=A0A345SZ91_9ACTN|nr:helix-turn-helix domain-containing protein [Peterkaempfera bronchialis]AXI79046.1 PucR family transcriptional regulator [Peterkaempfera bronchialis]